MWIRLLQSCSLIKLSNRFVSSDQEPGIINTLYGWSGIYDHFLLWSSLFSLVWTSKLNIFECYKNKIRNEHFPFKLINNGF